MNKLPDTTVLNAITDKLLSPKTRSAIIAAASASLGSKRDLKGILALADRHGASRQVVAAAFGFLPDFYRPRRYVDVLTADEGVIAALPEGTEIAAAFALSRAVHPAGGQVAVG